MKLGIIGLGRMGAAIAYRAQKAGHCVLGYDPNVAIQKELQESGIQIYQSPEAMAVDADVIWLMVPAGKIVDETLKQVIHAAKKDAIIIDGGNSHFSDSVRRAKELALKGLHFLDCGTSGGIHGQMHGFCLMIGGDFKIYEKLIPLLQAIACKDGYAHVGPSGAGHYVKMIHNGIEYGMLQAYAEGFHLLREGDYADLDLQQISKLWQHGAVIRSFLLELAVDVFKEDQNFASIDGKIQEGGTGAWTVESAHKNNIPVPVIETSLKVRAESRTNGGNFATKLIQMLRNAFGGHAVQRTTY